MASISGIGTQAKIEPKYGDDGFEPIYKKLLRKFPPLKNSEGWWKTHQVRVMGEWH